MFRLEEAPSPTGLGEVVFAGLDSLEEEIRLVRRMGEQAIWYKDCLLPIPGVPHGVGIVDRLGDCFVVVSRLWDGQGGKPSRRPNVWLLDSLGAVRREFSIGDCFSHIATDATRNIWVGYGDQAVEWCPPPGSDHTGCEQNETYSMPGLIHWDERGIFEWVISKKLDLYPGMYHCYALNSGRAGVIVAVDIENAIIRVDEEAISVYPSSIIGPRGIAFDGERVMFLGRYEPRKRRRDPITGFDVVTVAEIKDGCLRIRETGRVTMPDGEPLPGFPQGVSSRGRSILMHFGDPASSYRLRLPSEL
jgi:hypothetical protein